ncbi:MAG TPA: glycosyltransferase family 4 protein [Balneolales bacterium]|nr:glycosyltransferase family 4 protein [Balneolales bacterium]
MKLLMISQDFPPDVGGIQTYCQELADRFVHLTHKFSVVAPDRPDANHFDNKTSYRIYRVSGRNVWLPATSMPTLHNLVYNAGYNVTFHAQWQTILSSYQARRKGDIKAIFCAAHGRELLFNVAEPGTRTHKWYDGLRKFFLNEADHFFAVSNYTADLLQGHGVACDRITVMPNGTNPDQFYPGDASEIRERLNLKDTKTILTICRLVRRKGVDTVIRAFSKVVSTHPEAKLIIIGDGEDRQRLETLASDLGVRQSVRFTGWIAHDGMEINQFYNLADIVVMTPRTDPVQVEGFGIVYLEANACGKPVIGSRSGGIPDAVMDGETGLLVDEDNPDQLAEAMKQLLDNPDFAERLGLQGLQRVVDDLNWDAIAKRIFNKIDYIANMENKFSGATI